MTEYIYELAEAPNLDRIRRQMIASAMTNKSLTKMDWATASGELKVYFDTALSAGDADIFDDIVAASSVFQNYEGRGEIMGEIFRAMEADPAQVTRMLGALDKRPTFAFVIDNGRYDLARMIAGEEVTAGAITAADYSLIDGILPVWVDE